MCAQSFESPRRTMNALVRAAKNMTTAASRTIKPVSDARRDAPRPPEPPPKSSPRGGSPPPFQISVVRELAILPVYGASRRSLALMLHRRSGQWRVRLHYIVPGRARNAVLVWTMVHHWVHAGEIVERRRRGNRPFQRRRFPGIRSRPGAFLQAPEQVDHENDLRRDCEKRGVSHECVDGHQLAHEFEFLEIGIPPRIAAHAQEVHRREDRVYAEERQVEVPLAERLVHHASEHLW